MTTVLYNETASGPGLAQLEQILQIGRHQKVAVINAPPESELRPLAVSRANPYDVDVVIAFVTRRVDVALIRAAYSAVGAGRRAWVVYPEPGQPGTDLRWEWFLAALRQYGVEAVRHAVVDNGWSAVLLGRKLNGDPEPDLIG
ncbi:hypothetical protein BST28_17645 [Mycolicibacter kumamotonensis]|uniref:Uncharacterized protein n=1 Tax=Mycolicibacter kumamotonensis TaxID=354243 RepID=A0A1X0E0Q7_9MYCO|nr:hypothetical protein [Mycolicibacter kumamotonensis]ORA77620.1 hypothetical protein BST28_17645 [Mycolicibacter kumamotonensis]